MKNKKVMMCPFRTVTETFHPLMAGQPEITRTNFELCLEKTCHAYCVEHGKNGGKAGKCRRLKWFSSSRQHYTCKL
ncbi:MAG: hypothetical protein ACLUDZ_08255 [Roseburia intestinalis]|jgi:hypothetical protein|nr:MAG TPA: hypothetical protein [Caudoviricetes sp.]